MHVPSTQITTSDPRLDALRDELFRRAELFCRAAEPGRRAELPAAADRLATSARAAFAAEEARLEAAGAPSLVRHALQHERFLADVAIVGELARRGDDGALDALRPGAWVSAWLAAHEACEGDAAELPRSFAA